MQQTFRRPSRRLNRHYAAATNMQWRGNTALVSLPCTSKTRAGFCQVNLVIDRTSGNSEFRFGQLRNFSINKWGWLCTWVIIVCCIRPNNKKVSVSRTSCDRWPTVLALIVVHVGIRTSAVIPSNRELILWLLYIKHDLWPWTCGVAFNFVICSFKHLKNIIWRGVQWNR